MSLRRGVASSGLWEDERGWGWVGGGLQPWCRWERGGGIRRREGEEMATEIAAAGFVAVRKREEEGGRIEGGV